MGDLEDNQANIEDYQRQLSTTRQHLMASQALNAIIFGQMATLRQQLEAKDAQVVSLRQLLSSLEEELEEAYQAAEATHPEAMEVSPEECAVEEAEAAKSRQAEGEQ
jgi:peptidoglycan hydrolase CwlO-like protein